MRKHLLPLFFVSLAMSLTYGFASLFLTTPLVLKSTVSHSNIPSGANYINANFSLNLSIIKQAHANNRQAAQLTTASDGVLVKFKSTTSISNQRNALSSAGCRSNASFSIVNNLTHASITSNRTLDQTLSVLRANPDVEYAEPNFILSIDAIPDDPQFTNLYGLDNNAQTGGAIDADIDAPEAWDIETGTNTVVAVIDSGLDYNHVDIQGNVWSNSGEIANNGIDDDGNGYVDDVRGWDFANTDNDPMDDNNHGTHVAGTIAATGNNGVGVTGVNWSARVMPLKFITAAGTGGTADAIAAIDYAVANGARIINASWGGTFFSQALFDAISAANTAGVLFVAAAGNNGVDTDVTPNYPASYDIPNIISVAATDSTDGLAAFSNFGATSVDLGAPGVVILSTIPANAYASFSGTSMASPHVAGVATLALSREPTLSVAELSAALLDNTDPVGSLLGRTVTGGRLNAFNTLSSIGAPVPPPPVIITVSPDTASVPVGGNVQFSATGSTTAYTWSINSTAASITSAGGLLTGLAPGVITVTATDATGNTDSSANINIIQIQITPSSATLSTGATQQYTATGGFPPYAWSSNSPAIASVDAATGLLTALAAGTVTLSVVDNIGATASTNNIVITQPVLTPQTAVLAVNATLQFSATGGAAPYTWSTNNTAVASIGATTAVLSALTQGTVTVTAVDANGTTASSAIISVRTITVSPPTASVETGSTLQFTAAGGAAPYSWTSSSPAIATMNATTGLLTAVSAGTITIRATDADGIIGNSGTITATTPPPPAAVTITPQTSTLAAGQTLQFSTTGGAAPYTWRSSNPATATVSATGLLTAIAAGTSIVTVTDNIGSAVTSGTITVTQTQISPNSTFIGVGQTLQFSAIGGVTPYTWSSSNAAIASINATSGLLTSLSAGSVTISATDNIGQIATTANIVVSNILVSPQTANLDTGSTQQFTASGGTAPYTWTSSNTAIATVNATTGLVTTIAVGTAIISATDTNSISGSTSTITVVIPPPPIITITAPAAAVNLGATLQLTATGGSAPYTWSTSNATVASIGVTNGLISALTAGTVVATATDSGGFTGTSAIITIINPAPPPTAPALPPQIQPQTALLPVSGILTLTVLDGTAPFTWTSSNPTTTITFVDLNTIQLSSTAAGTTSLTVTDANNIAATTGLIEFRTVSVTATAASVDIGATIQMTATGGSPSYTWTVDNPLSATVDATGLVTGITAGTVTITATDVNAFAGNATISVIDPATTIIIAPQIASVPTGNTLAFSVNAPFGNMMNQGGLTWTSSNPAVATISNFGTLTAVSPGATVISVTDGAGNVGSTATITIDPPPPIVVTPQIGTIAAGTWLRFFATGGAGSYTWTVNDPAIAGINATSGWLFGVAPGTVMVTATDTLGNTASSSIITITIGGIHQ